MFDKNTLIANFAQEFGLQLSSINQHEREAIYWLQYSQALAEEEIVKNSENLDQKPLWGIIWRMLERSNRHAANSLVLLILGQPESAEILARTIMESAINVMYLLHADINEGLNAYFADYIYTERKQNTYWKNAIQKLKVPDEIAMHKKSIEQKEVALNLYEKVIRSAYIGLGAEYKPTANWKKISERFVAVNHEVSYRTIYAALCSQSHGDAEDILNELVISLTNDESLKNKLQQENINFSQMLIYSAIYFYLEAVGTFGYANGLKIVAHEMKKSYFEVRNIAEYYAKRIME
jgi:hypothetical protein